MWWELSSVFDGVRDGYLGWRNFKNATGKWPFWSVLSGVVSIPIVVAIGACYLEAALQTRRLVLIYDCFRLNIVTRVCAETNKGPSDTSMQARLWRCRGDSKISVRN
jgi:hypothetical protein